MSSSLSFSVAATVLVSILGGAGFWISFPEERKDAVNRVRELEAALGAKYLKHKERIENFFHKADKDGDGELTPEEIVDGFKAEEPTSGGFFPGKPYIFMFLGFDVVFILLAMIGLSNRNSKKTPLTGKGTLQVKLHCVKGVSPAPPAGAPLAPPKVPVKFHPTVVITFDGAKVPFTEHPGADSHHPGDPLVLDIELKKPLNIDFDFVNKKALTTDPDSKKYPKSYFRLEVTDKAEAGSDILGECEVDVAELLAKHEMNVHLGQEVVSGGLCKRRAGKYGELQISVGSWIRAPAPAPVGK